MCMLTLIIFLGAISTVHQNPFLPYPSPVTAESIVSTAVVSMQNVTDLSKGPGSTVVYNVTLTTSPLISGFNVWVQFDPNVLSASTSSIDYSGNILGSDAQVQSECINNQPVVGQCQDYPLGAQGVVNLGMFYLGNKTNTVPGGLLYRLTLTVLKAGFSQIHLLEVVLVNGGKNENYVSTNVDGLFVNKNCGSTFCKPPHVEFTFSPIEPSLGSTVTFNASTSKATNANSQIANYRWFWGEICHAVATTQDTPDPIIPHTFCNAQNYPVALTVTDTQGISWVITKNVKVIYVFVDVTYGGIDVDHQFGVYVGTIVHVTAGIRNNSTLPVKANLTITLDTGKVLGNKTFNLSERGGAGATTGTLSLVPWDTNGYSPRVYRIDIKVDSNVPQNVTSDKSASTFVQLIVSPPGGALSLSLFQTTGLGLIVLIGLAAGLARFRKKPSWEREPL